MDFAIITMGAALLVYYIAWGIPGFNERDRPCRIFDKAICFHNEMKSSKDRLYNLLRWSIIPIAILIAVFIYWICLEKKNLSDIQNILVMVLGAIPACVLWYYRDKAKQKDQEHTERDLEHTERDLAMKEKNDIWDNLIKFMKMAEGRDGETDNEQATAIYALGEYYQKSGTEFPMQVHQFFENYTYKYKNEWKKNKEKGKI
jgi:hypothetical protein